MKYLLDTHTLIWVLFEPKKLSKQVRTILEDRNNIISISSISFWETSLKFGLGKLVLPKTLPDELPEAVKKMGFSIADLTPDLLASYHRLKPDSNHKDPFDRLLVWQAIREGCCLISKDKKLPGYENQGLQTLW